MNKFLLERLKRPLPILSIMVTIGVLFSSTALAAGVTGGRWLQPSITSNHPINLVSGVITGHVVKGTDGTAIANGQVIAYLTPDIYLSTTTDANGKYSFDGLMPGLYKVSAVASGYLASSQSNVSVNAGATVTVDFSLNPASPAQSAGSLTGQVKDAASGNAISGATMLILKDSALVQGTLTDANGLYVFSSVAVGTYQVLAFAPGHNGSLQDNVQINANATTTLNFSLSLMPTPFKGSITGKITNATNGQPISGAQISAKFGEIVMAAATSDVNGNYLLSDLLAGTYSLQASASGYVSATLANVLVSANSTTTVNFALNLLPTPVPTTGSQEGHVVSAESGQPIAGAIVEIELKVSIPSDGNDTELQTTTDANGKYHFAQVEPGIYKLEANAEGFHRAKVDGIAILSSETAVVNVALLPKEPQQKGKIAGQVSDADTMEPIAGALVFFTPSRGQDKDRFARTDSQGKYTLDSVLVGTYQVHAMAAGYKPAKVKDVQVESDQTVTVNFVLEPLPWLGHGARSDDDDEGDKDDNRHHGHFELEISGQIQASSTEGKRADEDEDDKDSHRSRIGLEEADGLRVSLDVRGVPGLKIQGGGWGS